MRNHHIMDALVRRVAGASPADELRETAQRLGWFGCQPRDLGEPRNAREGDGESRLRDEELVQLTEQGFVELLGGDKRKEQRDVGGDPERRVVVP